MLQYILFNSSFLSLFFPSQTCSLRQGNTQWKCSLSSSTAFSSVKVLVDSQKHFRFFSRRELVKWITYSHTHSLTHTHKQVKCTSELTNMIQAGVRVTLLLAWFQCTCTQFERSCEIQLLSVKKRHKITTNKMKEFKKRLSLSLSFSLSLPDGESVEMMQWGTLECWFKLTRPLSCLSGWEKNWNERGKGSPVDRTCRGCERKNGSQHGYRQLPY